ncbi:hypothetical protein DICVIV_12457 [Dictyocaulus viviparus]|uniref:Uncharacterized protein n=1 Tax=Dictyocaulus viviparus TaxID=29172 RepID=A0A0D8XAD6_DICVI|nr:hypothetical protein DICVIV_12457 [Dictyocaulus viviparus]
MKDLRIKGYHLVFRVNILQIPCGFSLIFYKLGYVIAACNRKRRITSENNTILAAEITQLTQEIAKHQSFDESSTFESSGVHEFTGSNAERRGQQNAAKEQYKNEKMDIMFDYHGKKM